MQCSRQGQNIYLDISIMLLLFHWPFLKGPEVLFVFFTVVEK